MGSSLELSGVSVSEPVIRSLRYCRAGVRAQRPWDRGSRREWVSAGTPVLLADGGPILGPRGCGRHAPCSPGACRFQAETLAHHPPLCCETPAFHSALGTSHVSAAVTCGLPEGSRLPQLQPVPVEYGPPAGVGINLSRYSACSGHWSLHQAVSQVRPAHFHAWKCWCSSKLHCSGKLLAGY